LDNLVAGACGFVLPISGGKKDEDDVFLRKRALKQKIEVALVGLNWRGGTQLTPIY
jgi:hypothetical protein